MAGTTWIIDGHNVIYHVPRLEKLQTSGAKREAREALAEVCLAFAARRNESLVLVFDGVPGFTEGAGAFGHLEITYAPYGGKADDMIVLRTDKIIDAGGRVTVVTNDRDLKLRLHRNATAIGSGEFWKLTKPPRKPTGEQRPDIPLQDVEAFFLEQEERVLQEIQEQPERDRQRKPPPRRTSADSPRPKPTKRSSPQKPAAPRKRSLREEKKPASKEPHVAEKLRMKKEKGKRKQAKRLQRRKRR